MKRNPEEQFIKEKISSIKVKKIYPRFFFRRCNKCGFEYKKEYVYKCSLNDRVLENITYTYYGCNHCFDSKELFIKYLRDAGIIYTEESLRNIYQKMDIR